ncbi:hypothetical protein GYMLUDRAFT_382205 [Collybiopsis luxurians FD-317 M1]|nr:hypothetical protein GYMLUDRAFT_382205 [Collybiopsis luxurians FD-317 M1]
MVSTSTFLAPTTVDSNSANARTVQDLLQRALLEYDASRQNRSLRYQWLEPQAAQQLVDHLQLILDAGQGDLQYLGLLRHLSRWFQTLPVSLIVEDVSREGQNPVAGGGFADIWRGSLEEKPVCLKVLRLTIEQDEKARSEIRKQFCHEALVWRQLKHPNILPLLGVNTDLFSPSFCLISPWMKNRDIITYLKQNPRHSLPSVLCDVAAGLRYLHSKDPPLIHGDLRGGNILVTDNLHCCLADFGLTLVTTSSQAWSITTSSNTSKGSMRWLAPEYIFGLSEPEVATGCKHTSRDVYAFGCTIVEILTQKVPFYDLKTDALVMFKLMNGGRPTRPSEVWCPDAVWDLTTHCWAENMQDRPSVNEVYETLQGVLQSASTLGGPSAKSTIVGAGISSGFPPLGGDTSAWTGQPKMRELKRKREDNLTNLHHQNCRERSPQGPYAGYYFSSFESLSPSLWSPSPSTGNLPSLSSVLEDVAKAITIPDSFPQDMDSLTLPPLFRDLSILDPRPRLKS